MKTQEAKATYTTCIYLDPEIRERLKKVAKAESRSVSYLVRLAIEKYLEAAK